MNQKKIIFQIKFFIKGKVVEIFKSIKATKFTIKDLIEFKEKQ